MEPRSSKCWVTVVKIVKIIVTMIMLIRHTIISVNMTHQCM